MGQKQVQLLHVLWESPPSRAWGETRCWAQKPPVHPSPNTETVAISFVPEKNVWLLVISAVVREHMSAQVEGIKICESVGWYKASGQLCRVRLPRQVVHKDLVLLSMALSLLVFNQIIDGCWYWLNS